MTKFDLILWDIDGTLLHGNGLGREAVRQSLETVFGVGAGAGMANWSFGGKTDLFTITTVLEPYGLDAAQVQSQLATYRQALAETMERLAPSYDVREIPGARTLLERLTAQDDLLHGLVTGNMQPSAHVKLRAADYDSALFPFGAFGDESTDRNQLPPLAIARASQRAGRDIPPERVLVLGDTLMDIQAARATGAQVAAVATGYDTQAELAAAQPDYLLEDLTQFEELVGM